MALIDNQLIAQAEQFSTGANVHKVNEAISKYQSEIFLGNLKGWDRQREERVEQFEKELRALVVELQLSQSHKLLKGDC